MIPTKALSLRAYLRDNDRLELPPHPSTKEYLNRMQHCRREKLKSLRATRKSKDTNYGLQK